MPHKRRTIAVTDGKLNGDIYEIRKVSDAIFKDIMGYLHNARSVLQDRDFRAFVHFQCTQHQTVFGLHYLTWHSWLGIAFDLPHECQNR